MSEKKVTQRSSLTAHERKVERLHRAKLAERAAIQRNNPRLWAEIRLSEIYRNTPPARAKPAPAPIPYTARPPRPDIRDPQHRPLPPIIEGEFKHVGDGRNIWSKREMLRHQLSRAKRLLGKLTPWLRAIELALDLYDLEQMRRAGQRPAGGLKVAPGWRITDRCSGGPGVITRSGTWHSGSCSSYYATVASETSWNYFTYHNVDYNDIHSTLGWPRHYPLARVERFGSTAPTPSITNYPFVPPFISPMPNAPSVPVPARPILNDMLAKAGPIPFAQPPRQPPKLRRDVHRWRPPPKRTKEKKSKMPAWLADMTNVAFGVTEAIDVIELMFDALPANVKRNTVPTGRTYGNARIGVGKPYLSATDKALAVWRNLGDVDMTKFVPALIQNQIIDYAVGSTSGSAGDFLKKNGVTVKSWKVGRA